MIDEPNDQEKLSKMSFGEVLEKFTQTDPQEVAVLTNASMKDAEIEKLIAAFEAAAQFDETGAEYWTARDVAKTA